MGLFDWLRPKRTPADVPRFSDTDIKNVGAIARRMADVVNESIQIAYKSQDPETTRSRVGVARAKIEELKQLGLQYPFLVLTSHAEVEANLAELEARLDSTRFRELAEGNARGEALEKRGDTSSAIAEYERLVALAADTPFTYRRLAILYRKAGRKDDELRILRKSLGVVPKTNATHHAWLCERLAKLK